MPSEEAALPVAYGVITADVCGTMKNGRSALDGWLTAEMGRVEMDPEMVRWSAYAE